MPKGFKDIKAWQKADLSAFDTGRRFGCQSIRSYRQIPQTSIVYLRAWAR